MMFKMNLTRYFVLLAAVVLLGLFVTDGAIYGIEAQDTTATVVAQVAQPDVVEVVTTTTTNYTTLFGWAAMLVLIAFLIWKDAIQTKAVERGISPETFEQFGNAFLNMLDNQVDKMAPRVAASETVVDDVLYREFLKWREASETGAGDAPKKATVLGHEVERDPAADRDKE